MAAGGGGRLHILAGYSTVVSGSAVSISSGHGTTGGNLGMIAGEGSSEGGHSALCGGLCSGSGEGGNVRVFSGQEQRVQGYSAASDSGSTGQVSVRTGSTCKHQSGSIQMSTGYATAGKAGDTAIAVSAGDSQFSVIDCS